ncbi:hypothetical protein EV356DRAFT_509542 [Viridothelium virens]|uniref:DUF7728 domain-containing protein n=1 Tax=Viridothelium virens TaxID=1048519 RepID=A0A6A6GW57_VIRVR|nr:hypothetical protein EV356DRAFT_509542 [Viridothelium virens]
MLRPLALGASLALTASALLIPSTSVELDRNAQAKAMTLAGMMPLVNTAILKLDCASCVLEDSQQEDGSGDNALLLNFTTSGNVLLLNDAPIYPTSMDFSPLRVTLVDAGSNDLKEIMQDSTGSGNSRTATSYGIQSSSSGTDSDGHQTTTVTVNLYALDQSPISVDEVHVNLVDVAPAHNLVIQTVSTSPSPNSPSDPNPGNPTTGDAAYKDCAGLPPLLCKWRSILAHKLSDLKPAFSFRKGCHGKPSIPGRPDVPDTAELKGADNEADNDGSTHLPTHIKGIPPSNRFGSHGHPHMHGGHHHGHGHHHGFHRFMHAFIRAFVGVLIPVLVGVIAGMAASIIGMAIGQFVAFIYMRVRGHRAAAPDYIVVEQEDRSSMESEPLPVYKEADEDEMEKGEAPPEYRDVAVVEEGKKGEE